jgi:enoyl-CoA hydratase/carnithine racemase
MSTLKLSVAKDGIAVVTLANPPMNVMDGTLLEKLANLFEGLAADRAVRAAVIAAEGSAFSAGLDLKTTPGLDRLGQRRLIDALNDSFGTLYAWPKPLVAAVNGHAIAGGLILALCADWRVVADAPMQISLAEVRVGVTYPVAPLQIARAELSPSAARRLILLGETVDAAAAEALAIVDERVPSDALLARAISQAERHASLPPQAFATTKRELRATELERIAAARAGQGEPRLAAWLGDEMRRASAAMLRASSAVRRGAA